MRYPPPASVFRPFSYVLIWVLALIWVMGWQLHSIQTERQACLARVSAWRERLPVRRGRKTHLPRCRFPLQNTFRPGWDIVGWGAQLGMGRASASGLFLADAPLRSRKREPHSALKGSKLPALRALMRATYLADTTGLPTPFLEWNRAAGLAHLLAVSGQHVLLFAWLLSWLYRGIWWVVLRRIYVTGANRLLTIGLDLALPLSALILLGLCPTEGSVFRSAIFAAIITCARCYGWPTRPAALWGFGVFAAAVLSPTSVLDWGFLLSCAGCFALVGYGHALQPNGANYLQSCLVVPFLMLPFQLHFFGTFDRWGLLHAVALSWCWNLVWIPLGFAAPIFLLIVDIPILSEVLSWLDLRFSAFMEFCAGLPLQSQSMLRPGFVEACSWQLLLISCLEWFNRKRRGKR